MFRGGLERIGMAALIAGALCVAKDKKVTYVGSCSQEPSSIEKVLVYDSAKTEYDGFPPPFKIYKVPRCGGEDPNKSNLILIESQSRIFGISFLPRTSKGTEYGYIYVVDNCLVIPKEGQSTHNTDEVDLVVNVHDGKCL